MQKLEFLVQTGVIRGNGSHNDIGMTVHILGQRIHDDISSQLQGTLEIRRQESVIDNQDHL